MTLKQGRNLDHGMLDSHRQPSFKRLLQVNQAFPIRKNLDTDTNRQMLQELLHQLTPPREISRKDGHWSLWSTQYVSDKNARIWCLWWLACKKRSINCRNTKEVEPWRSDGQEKESSSFSQCDRIYSTANHHNSTNETDQSSLADIQLLVLYRSFLLVFVLNMSPSVYFFHFSYITIIRFLHENLLIKIFW